jgi:hypothetical protein
VATTTDRVLARAIAEVGQDLRRQINDAKTRSEPRNNRLLRGTARTAGLDAGPTDISNKELIT